MLAKLLLLAFFLANLPCATNAQCVPKPYSGKQEVFSSVVQNLKGPGVSVGPAGIVGPSGAEQKRITKLSLPSRIGQFLAREVALIGAWKLCH